jgi:anthranilate phosphoribosyltransferase
VSNPLAEIMDSLGARRELTDRQLRWVVAQMIEARLIDDEAAAFLLGLRAKGESAAEIACAAQVLREHMMHWDSGRDDLLDTCGTGGDGIGTFNISTATALVAAGAGVPVVKHGNRSVSSRSGSADVLAALGVRIDGDAAFARRCLHEANFAFCFAPVFHPALKNVAAVRRKLGVPTIFNCLGPLANPGGAKRQLLGVSRLDLLDRMTLALTQLGTEHAIVLCSQDGLDEVSLSAPTIAREIRGATIVQHQWTADDFGLETCTLDELFAPHADASAVMIQAVLEGEEGPAQRIVLANTAVALLAADKVSTLFEGVAAARAAIVSGKTRGVLHTLRQLSATN